MTISISYLFHEPILINNFRFLFANIYFYLIIYFFSSFIFKKTYKKIKGIFISIKKNDLKKKYSKSIGYNFMFQNALTFDQFYFHNISQ